MSQRAQRRVQKSAAITAQPVVDGSAARAMRPEPVSASELPASEIPHRVTLSLVPRITENNRKSVVVTSMIMVLLFVGVIVTLVLMNTSVAQRQYEIVSMRNHERALSQENQALLKEAQSLAAPQALAKKAKELGLVAPGAPGLIDLSDQKITQQAEDAVKTDGNVAINQSLPLPGEAINGSKAKAQEENKESSAPAPTVGKKDSTESKQDADKAAAADSQSAEQTKPQSSDAEKAKDDAKSEDAKPEQRGTDESGRPVFTEKELNGGTIPAPTMKSPTN